MKKNKCFIFKDNRFLKIIFLTLTSYLLFNEFYNFYVIKPTYTSSSENMIGINSFMYVFCICTNVFLSGIHDNPDIVLCPFPSYNFANLKSIGYDNAAWHAMGRIKDKSYLGWTGNTTNNKTSAIQIIQNISILQGRFSK